MPEIHKCIALVGNPNCGKTTLFNALTGARQRVGNWPGVTVERKSGFFIEAGKTVEVIDLPGIYSLTLANLDAAIDERIACEYIMSQQPDLIINIVDASNLERHLYLTIQLRELGVPVLLVLNMMDVAKARHLQIDCDKLSEELQCAVVAITAHKSEGLQALKKAILTTLTNSPLTLSYPAQIETAIQALMPDTMPVNRSIGIQLLENNALMVAQLPAPAQQKLNSIQQTIIQTVQEEADMLIADTRFHFIQDCLSACLKQTEATGKTWTSRIDNLVLNRFLGIPIFLGIMYLLFVFAINIGGAFQDFFDISSQTIFVDGLNYLLMQLGLPTWLIAILANGIGKGINTTITFVPVIGAMFLFLSFLEDSGYMARAAFVVDRLMRTLGLPGKAFVPMIVGFGCNVPAIMSARTLESHRDRIITIMMSPFMSCSARLAIFAVFTAAFFPKHGQNIVFALYLIGILMAVATGFILRKTMLAGEASPLILELPAYHVPRFGSLCLHAWHRLRGFVVRAGRLIVPICVLIGALNTLNVDGTLNTGEGGAHSILSWLGQLFTPLFAPMGVKADNWPATVGLVTGVLAKEVVVGTLNTLYSQMDSAANVVSDFHFWAGMKAAWQSIFTNFAELGNAFINPLLAKAPIDPIEQSVYGKMSYYFDGQVGAFSYLLFVLLYFPCVSTMAAMLRELSRGWAIFSACWMTGVAYGAATFFYQAATWFRHPLSSSLWMLLVIVLFVGTIFCIAPKSPQQTMQPVRS